MLFKYDVYETEEESELEMITLKSDEIKYKFEDNNLNVKIKPIQKNNINVNATYSIRVITQDNVEKEEIIDSIGVYSFVDEFIFTKSVNSKVDEIEININDFPSKEAYYYISVFVTCLSTKEILAYILILLEKEPHKLYMKKSIIKNI